MNGSLSHGPELGPRFEEALGYAFRLHAHQNRKGKSTPYIAHLLSVTALVLEAGGDEDQAIAALLHDAVEDQGGLARLEEIRDHFGPRVAAIVEGCTDSFTTPKPPWQQRKEAYLKHLKTAPRDVLLVSLADKLHNARSILTDLRKEGEQTWERFRGGKQGSLWYYRSLVTIFQERFPGSMADELSRVVDRIEVFSE